MNGWRKIQLTSGTESQRYHAHSYYDVPVLDSGERFVCGHEVGFTGRQPTPEDAIGIGYVDLRDRSAGWHSVGESRAWSWQQGALAQWLPGAPRLVWNDREGDHFVARVHDLETGKQRTLPTPIYAIHPSGEAGLALNMARLDSVRPGYGYPGGAGARLEERRPEEDGIWKVDLASGRMELLLSLQRASEFLRSRLTFRGRLVHWKQRYTYWFNHAKFSPDGRRFTVKLRFRRRGKGWNDQQGVSLTCGTDGEDLRLLTDGTSHVIWLDDQQLYLWQRDGVYLYRDEAPVGRRLEQFAPGRLAQNLHIRHLPDHPDRFVYDTPYQEDIDLALFTRSSGEHEPIAHFIGHQPKRGPFRCDLHPVPSRDGSRIIVTSLEDGGRQIYLLER